MAAPTLIYCADGNPKFAQIAIDCGYKYGAQLPNKIYFAPYFVDQNWKKPNRDKYMQALETYKPHMATVLDWEREEQLTDVIGWAEEAFQYVNVVVIVPKVHDGISRLPRTINGKEIRLGYSVPTKFGGTDVFLSEFVGWPIHLLGGSPKKQYGISKYLNVRSIDGNSHTKAAMKGNYWNGRKWIPGNFSFDIYELFRKSCEGIKTMWGLV